MVGMQVLISSTDTRLTIKHITSSTGVLLLNPNTTSSAPVTLCAKYLTDYYTFLGSEGNDNPELSSSSDILYSNRILLKITRFVQAT